jgi:hypothetical protein
MLGCAAISNLISQHALYLLVARLAKSDPVFQARPAQLGNWCVHVTWASGEKEIVNGFDNQYQALKWISDDSANWVVEKIMRR